MNKKNNNNNKLPNPTMARHPDRGLTVMAFWAISGPGSTWKNGEI
jgi:hypothetical protein